MSTVYLHTHTPHCMENYIHIQSYILAFARFDQSHVNICMYIYIYIHYIFDLSQVRAHHSPILYMYACMYVCIYIYIYYIFDLSQVRARHSSITYVYIHTHTHTYRIFDLFSYYTCTHTHICIHTYTYRIFDLSHVRPS